MRSVFHKLHASQSADYDFKAPVDAESAVRRRYNQQGVNSSSRLALIEMKFAAQSRSRGWSAPVNPRDRYLKTRPNARSMDMVQLKFHMLIWRGLHANQKLSTAVHRPAFARRVIGSRRTSCWIQRIGVQPNRHRASRRAASMPGATVVGEDKWRPAKVVARDIFAGTIAGALRTRWQ